MVPPQESAGSGSFATTPWALLLASRQTSHPSKSERALGRLCEIYWRPIFSFIIAQGCDRYEAEDLTQSFMIHLIERDRFVQADPGRGSFRSYVLGTLKNFLAHARRDERAQKRGGGAAILPLDETFIDKSAGETARGGNFRRPHPADRQWALVIEHRVNDRLAGEYAEAGKSELYLTLRRHLTADKSLGTYQDDAGRLGRPVATVRSDVVRLRRRYGELLLAELRKKAPGANLKQELLNYSRLLAWEE
jgi:RNA polymerase sigma-70 factor (ECF subfamily)